ncbi:MAG TPA: menaquinone biosynthesis protein [Nitrospirota bacterium]
MPNRPDERLRIGEIHYANCTPIYHMLKKNSDCADYDFIAGEPAKLNALLAGGNIDISSSSSIEYARHSSEYLIIPDISIGSRGEVRSILFFSKVPFEQLADETVAVSSASATSVVLLKVLAKFHFGFDIKLAPSRPVLGEMLEGVSAALIIGDDALAELGKRHEGLFVYDLGTIWQEFTGLPFVYALWMVRADSARRTPELVGRFKRDVKAAKEAALGSFNSIAEAASDTMWMDRAELVSYWENMSYDLTDAHIAGLKRFIGHAAQVGEVNLGHSGEVILNFL